jgi:hypothetical protein
MNKTINAAVYEKHGNPGGILEPARQTGDHL